MSNEVYFSNHGRALKFPWSLYHKPLIHSLESFLRKSAEAGAKTLVIIGPGDLPELELILSLDYKVSVLDIDPRVIEKLRGQYGSLIQNFFLVDANFMNYPADSTFDLVYAKEVIEHFASPLPFLQHIGRILKVKGKVWMSTPNYGFFLLPLLESTVLEIIARLSGFSRKTIHPSRFSKTTLESTFKKAGFEVENCEESFAKLALTIEAVKT